MFVREHKVLNGSSYLTVYLKQLYKCKSFQSERLLIEYYDIYVVQISICAINSKHNAVIYTSTLYSMVGNNTILISYIT